jgi:hypothetical protein
VIPERAGAAGKLHTLAERAEQQIARAPSPSKAAIQEVTSLKDGHAAPSTWEAEKRAWIAAHGGSGGARPTGAAASAHAPSSDVIASAASSQVAEHGAPRAPAATAQASVPGNGGAGGQVQRAPASVARPDLGNYDSPIGKRVLVLRGWDDTAIAARRVELQGRLSRTTEPKARDELLTEYQAIEWVAHERGLSLPRDPGEEAAPQAYAGGKPIKFWIPETAQGMRAMLEREIVSAGVNLTVAAGLFKRAMGLRQMAMSGNVDRAALAALNKAGDELGVKAVGDEAVSHEPPRGLASRNVAASSEVIEVRGVAQRPHLQWAKNTDGSVRSIDEAIQVARQNGVMIEDDILLRKVSGKFLPEQTYAEYFRARSNDLNKTIRWTEFFSKELDLLLVRVEQSVFESDEAIVAVLGHEMHELNSLRRIFEEKGGTMTYRQLHYLISPGIKGNLHDQAWDIADQLVLAMRKNSGKR